MDKKFKDVGEIEDRLLEECGEVIQAISKARRFGYFNFHPDRPESNNLDDILAELKDLKSRIREFENCAKNVKKGTAYKLADLRVASIKNNKRMPLR